jgi:hypothetical protein
VFIKADHGKTEPTGLIHQQEDSSIRKAAVMISVSDVL